MAIRGERPETGVRVDIARSARAVLAPWEYAGTADTPSATYEVRVVVGAGGTVDVSSPTGSLPADLATKIGLVVRALYKQAASEGQPPPRRIVRWREK